MLQILKNKKRKKVQIHIHKLLLIISPVNKILLHDEEEVKHKREAGSSKCFPAVS